MDKVKIALLLTVVSLLLLVIVIFSCLKIYRGNKSYQKLLNQCNELHSKYDDLVRSHEVIVSQLKGELAFLREGCSALEMKNEALRSSDCDTKELEKS
ncbi:hypothetical protein [Ehrlichia canis]|uniref:hypothetical protein n=1 Tax=Ehrlichia canis TaxID=944 RepID=UPI00003A8407|nr:hypothetical protein [Ehrlichia canis]AUO54503.1 hypothetical protein C1I72_01110 [Ehrlichia canis]UKC53816.1 hypothetical protein s20019040002_000861 [Ehrlichia canis]UKC54752.1 hypothetical protein s20026770001_000860 [Ehrlichia canis]UKC55688.1 hypothetical protein s21009500007_000860 [Ehrlichia canis]